MDRLLKLIFGFATLNFCARSFDFGSGDLLEVVIVGSHYGAKMVQSAECLPLRL